KGNMLFDTFVALDPASATLCPSLPRCIATHPFCFVAAATHCSLVILHTLSHIDTLPLSCLPLNYFFSGADHVPLFVAHSHGTLAHLLSARLAAWTAGSNAEQASIV
ncbi:hypothetical protein BCR44DRAFT_35859, partial [Catenaria anguillulae PL171]